MSTIVAGPVDVVGAQPFVERRASRGPSPGPQHERRQFTNTYHELSPEAREVALAIDAYKLKNRRRFISYEEVLGVMKTLGYSRNS
ncbi:hypothetical protein Psta_4288 [Pirellula staleyi DSM 6068]|uniref:Uncharacterized protein n=1 Tax=Pirellula staleyi (strain ATCC 27377 / DSM 6068 / ICPB 4128) TaxID=530564 RepID=D2R4X4_PIRSD|nr:hypothetical protein [Pirellula staleyi]ADB18936.1 hypothetical protein Psta_4288 [Pirellula staleyi DSM 6068]